MEADAISEGHFGEAGSDAAVVETVNGVDLALRNFLVETS